MTAWRRATVDDLDAMMTIQERAHSLLPERAEIAAEKMRLFNEGCLVFAPDGICVGYGIAHPWTLDTAPALDTFLGALPDKADCLFIHDVALLPEARGHGAAKAYVALIEAIARNKGLGALALISVYGTDRMWGLSGFRRKPVDAMAAKLAAYGETAVYMTKTLA